MKFRRPGGKVACWSIALKGLLLAMMLAGSVFVQASTPLKVGFVYIGPIEDAGWNKAHDTGRLALEAQLGE